MVPHPLASLRSEHFFFSFESRLFHYFKTRVLIETKAAGGTFVNAQF